jgi:hypothetical protein
VRIQSDDVSEFSRIQHVDGSKKVDLECVVAAFYTSKLVVVLGWTKHDDFVRG